MSIYTTALMFEMRDMLNDLKKVSNNSNVYAQAKEYINELSKKAQRLQDDGYDLQGPYSDQINRASQRIKKFMFEQYMKDQQEPYNRILARNRSIMEFNKETPTDRIISALNKLKIF